MEHVYSDPANYDWPRIRAQWEENWAKTNPYATVKLQKTPADIFRVPQMTQHFDDLKWVVSVKNPYAYVESIMSKTAYYLNPETHMDQICFHVLRTMEIQIANQKYLGDRAYSVTLEDFSANPELHRDALVEFVPELDGMRVDQPFMVKGRKCDSIKADGLSKATAMLAKYPEFHKQINSYFKPLEHILAHWGYEVIEA